MPDAPAQPHAPRYALQLPARCQLKGPVAGSYGVAWTRDLSEGGVCLELPGRVEPTTRLALTIHTYRGAVPAQATVAWAGSAGGEGRVLHGVTFTQIAPGRQAVLHAMMHQRQTTRQGILRLPLDVPFQCVPKGPPRTPLTGRTGDIGPHGVLLHLHAVLPVGTEVTLTLQASGGPVQVEGVVAWVEPAVRPNPGGMVHHGLRLSSTPGTDWEDLARMMGADLS